MRVRERRDAVDVGAGGMPVAASATLLGTALFPLATPRVYQVLIAPSRNCPSSSSRPGMVLLHHSTLGASFSHPHLACDAAGSYCRFPPGVVNTVPSLGSVGGAALSAHKDVDKVAFTGSTVTGRRIMEAAAKSNLKKVCIHLLLEDSPPPRRSANSEQRI